MQRWCQYLLVTLTVLTFSTGISGTVISPAIPRAKVSINCGKIDGVWSKSSAGFSFRGIPYASPPVGNLRWRPPVPVRRKNRNCWKGILQAHNFQSQCVQRDKENHSIVFGNEDCLYLNVLTPTLNSSAKLPVMFWIHGGYLLYGNGNQYNIGYAPTLALAKQLNVVFVSINYRLNAFGFMALKWLQNNSSTNTSGNYGFMDMIEGLRWVQKNIHKFGGDPNQVTAFGQSSGGTSLIALLSSPLCQGLFDKVLIMGASPVMNKTAEEAFKDNEIFIKNTGCSDVSCLYELPAYDVIINIPWGVYPYWAMEDILSLPEFGKFDGALIVIDGTTAQEVDVAPIPRKFQNWTWQTNDYKDHVTKKLGTFNNMIARAALNLYPVNVSTPEFQYTTMVTDARIGCATDYLATVLASGMTSPVYRYVATYYTKGHSAKPFGTKYPVNYAYHGIDVFGFFQTMNVVLGAAPESLDTRWENHVQSEILAFVKTGSPATGDWLKYPDVTAELDTETKPFRSYHAAQCEFWLQNGFFSYSWIN
ncbi:para-nitrobenzyl esterase-like isoform X2 [Ruditapes philippinarum]|uniref:para-nitrobenzyl esterase-like isoform X2 n=1 Tax=Ruditapes philippinarum TaxID=129788 RepID=UPI00295BC7CF|nr:para-nitrobenzyl esterase-like isoform X2 [Ruditapes philippinarum]